MDELTHHEFSIGLPEAWVDRTEVILVGPAKDGSSPTVTVKRIVLKAPQTLEQFVGFQLHGLRELVGVKPIDIVEERDTTLGGLPAYMRTYHLRYLDKFLMQRQVYALRGLVAYVLTETSGRERFEGDLPLFDEILKKFQFKAAAA